MGGVLAWEEGEPGDDGDMASWWYFEDLHYPMVRTHSAVKFPRDQLQMKGITYDEMIPGGWQLGPRLADMDRNHTASSLCFPSWLRFCGQHLSEGRDKDSRARLHRGLQRLDGRRVVRRRARAA